ncbi:MAG: hypothetical protein JWP83_2675, partial [Mycobacterium sp.]|nr:hypothetical protein [Mycobacterium sp.]
MPKSPQPAKRRISTNEAAQYLGISQKMLRKAVVDK